MGQERRECVAVAVLHYYEHTSVVAVGLYLGDPVIAAEEGRVAGAALHEVKEQGALLTVGEGGVVIGRGHIVVVVGDIVGEGVGVVGKLLIVVAERVHRAEEVLLDIHGVGGEVGVGDIGLFSEYLGCVVGSERLPVVVGARVDVLACVIVQRVVYVNIYNALEVQADVLDALVLVGELACPILGQVVCRCKRYVHIEDVDGVAERFLIFVDDVCVLLARGELSVEGRHRSYVLALACDDNVACPVGLVSHYLLDLCGGGLGRCGLGRLALAGLGGLGRRICYKSDGRGGRLLVLVNGLLLNGL